MPQRFITEQGGYADALNTGDVRTWAAYTPLFNTLNADGVLGNGVTTGFYRVVRDTLFYSIELDIGGTTNVGTGAFLLGLPAGFTADNAQMLGLGSALSSGFASQISVASANFPLAQAAAINAAFGAGTPVGVAFVITNSATGAVLDGTSPFAFAAGDAVVVCGSIAII